MDCFPDLPNSGEVPAQAFKAMGVFLVELFPHRLLAVAVTSPLMAVAA